MERKCNWPLGNGSNLTFWVYEPESTTWHEHAGLYIFAYYDKELWHAVYVGETEDFSQRLPNHERWSEAVRYGATHIHSLIVREESTRFAWEKMLIEHLSPVLNTQYNK